uniref:G-protein coupled receptors family 1 profile domain-containing protein n=1 Tax=Loxodonta africana TaxID=9785 RepID=G3TMS0_LOXAF
MISAKERAPKKSFGFSDRPWLQMPFFVVLLISYKITIFGNVSIMMVCTLNPKLHTPMCFFLASFSILDLCYNLNTVPHMLANICCNKKTISLGCYCLLLAIMSFDRFVVTHYVGIMNHLFYPWMAAIHTGFSNSVLQSSLTFNMLWSSHKEVDHFFCEVPALLKCCHKAYILLIPVMLILISYGFIVQAILTIRLAKDQKSFGTCGSHLIMVSLFGTGIYIYLQPPSSTSKDWEKMVSIFCGIITPMLNPLIYNLRNKNMKEVFKKVMPRIIFFKKYSKMM